METNVKWKRDVENFSCFSRPTTVKEIKAKRVRHTSKINDSLQYISEHFNCKLFPVLDTSKPKHVDVNMK